MENIVFKQSLMGFNRQQVLLYIDTLVSHLKEQEEEYSTQQEKLEEEINSLTSTLASNKEDLKLTVDKIKQLSTDIEFFKQNNEDLKKQIQNYRTLLLEKDREIVQLKKDCSDLEQKQEETLAENFTWKAKQEEIATCLVEANVRAKEIIAKAHLDAVKKQAEFENNANQLYNQVDAVKQEIMQVEQQLEDSFQKLRSAMQAMDESAQNIQEQVLTYKSQAQSLTLSTAQDAQDYQAQGTNNFAQALSVSKRTLTESVLDALSNLMDK